ncbi:MAG: EAL domain-containing protein, partial [Gammaproteobacteria bacterium]
EKIVALDKGVIGHVIDHLQGDASSSSIAVNLSTRTIKNSDFRSWFVDLLKQHDAIKPRLIISLSAYAVAKDFNAYQEFIKFVHNTGVRILLKRFDSQSLPLDRLKSLKPDFVRLSRELSNNLEGNAEKIAFLQTVKEIGDLLDITILAENIQSDTDFTIAKNIGLAGASR